MVSKKIFTLMFSKGFGTIVKNVTKHRDIKLGTTESRRNYLVSGPNHHTTIFFREFISNRNEKETDTYE